MLQFLSHSLPEFLNFKLFGKPFFLVNVKLVGLFLGHPASGFMSQS